MESNTPSDRDTEDSPSGAGPSDPLLSLQIVWVALLLSLGIYAVIAYTVAKQVANGAQLAPLPAMQMAFAMISLSSVTVAYVLSRKLLKQAIGTDDPATLPVAKLARLAFTPWILRMAMTESVGIFGLLMAMLTGQPSSGLPFLIVSALVMLTHLPNEKALRTAAQQ